MTISEKQHAHELLDRVPPGQMTEAVRFLEALVGTATVEEEDEDISAAEELAVARSKEWFQHNDGIPFEQVVADLGFSMEQIRSSSREDPAV